MTTKNTIPAPTTTSITQCTNCNGDLTFNPSAQTLDCAFCKSSYTLTGETVTTETDVTDGPKFIIPFAVSKEVFDKVALEWLAGGAYTPPGVLDNFTNSSTKGIYLPLYVWDIDYVIASPEGNRQSNMQAVDIAEVAKSWPDEIKDYARSAVINKKQTTTYNKAFTLGFEVWEDGVSDVNAFNKKAHVFAVESVLAANNLKDAKSVVINNMEFTKVYGAYWINKYTWQNQDYQIIMSGFDASKVGGIRPIDKKAEAQKRPHLQVIKYPLLAGLLIIVLSIILQMASTQLHTYIKAIAGIGCVVMFGVTPLLWVITIIRIVLWRDPEIKMSRLRQQKLAERIK